MIRATSILRRPAVKAERVADTITLDHEARHRRRIALKADGGLDFLLDLDKATALNDGDAVKLEDGRLVQVKAAPQPLLEIRAENPLRLMRLAWHIGNRHTPAEITADAVYIEADHVLAEMVRGQGGTAREVVRPFQPERGAYDHAECGHDHHGHDHHDHGHHGHDHHAHDDGHHGHGHEHHGHGHHAHAEAHSHAEAQAHSHEHGAACGCGHDHHEAHAHADAGHDHAHDRDHR